MSELPSKDLSSGPWKVERVERGQHFSGENWMIASLGVDHNDVSWYITTDRVHASQATSEPENDAHAIVEWRNSLWNK
jgi:hypothetical protein